MSGALGISGSGAVQIAVAAIDRRAALVTIDSRRRNDHETG